MAKKDLLLDEQTLAHPCFVLVSNLLGEEWLEWEPDTVWLTLKRQHNIDVPAGNRSQIMAFRNLVTTGRFWYDALVFSKTCAAFNNEEPDYDVFDLDVPVPWMNWAVYEATRLIKDFEFGPEVEKYVALKLFEDGYVVAPMFLNFAQEELDDMYPKEAKKLRKEVIKAWAEAPPEDDAPYPETPGGVQLALLATVRQYYRDRKTPYTRQMATVT